MHPMLVVLWASLALAGGCDWSSSEEQPEPSAKVSRKTPSSPAGDPLPAEAVRVAVVDLDTLQALEAPEFGGSLGAVLARAEGAAAKGPSSAAQLWTQTNLYRALSTTLSRDITAVIDGVERPLVTEHAHALRWPAGNVGRAFDVRWLKSLDAFFTLAGVVNRLDRRDLHEEPTCGEVRLIYRLAYRMQKDDGSPSSRLPLTLNLVFVPAERTACHAVARQWADLDDGPELAQKLTQGPLDFSSLVLDRFEVNAQVVRFPSGLETEFGGQAIYLLKVYDPAAGPQGVGVVTRLLENTPDVGRIESSPELREELVSWISEHIDDIDKGTYRLPDRFLASEALSYSTLGINRLANKPFSALFEGKHLRALPEPGGELLWVGSQRGLVERLDNGSCTGCHQAGSTAGFHLLGPDDPKVAGVTNRLASPISPHLRTELKRRRQYVADIASGRSPDLFRPHSLAPPPVQGKYPGVGPNQSCVPSEAREHLQASARWGCEQKTGTIRCEVVARDPRAAMNFGQCIPDPSRPRALAAGMTCRAAEVEAKNHKGGGGLWNLHAYADTVKQRPIYKLPEDPPFTAQSLHCRPTRIGVPLGRTYRRCTSRERSLPHAPSDSSAGLEICAVVGGNSFDLCVEGDFHKCLEQIIGRGMVARCSEQLPCREDAICQMLPWQLEGVPSEAGQKLSEAGIGFCTPTYFLFQLRLDGHPTPRLAP